MPVMDVSVIMQQLEFLPSSGDASDSAHLQSVGHFSCTTETDTHCANYADYRRLQSCSSWWSSFFDRAATSSNSPGFANRAETVSFWTRFLTCPLTCNDWFDGPRQCRKPSGGGRRSSAPAATSEFQLSDVTVEVPQLRSSTWS